MWSIVQANPNLFGWMSYVIIFVLGAAVGIGILYALRVRLLGRSVAEKYARGNAALRYQNETLRAENASLIEENAELRAAWHQATVKMHQGVSIITSGFNAQLPAERKSMLRLESEGDR